MSDARDISAARSLLFLPASNPRAIAKARQAGADFVALDLEDAVKPGDKDDARAAAVEAVGEPWPMPVAIRVNGVGSEWHDADCAAVAASKADYVIVPRAASAEVITAVAAATAKPVLAMIETAAGVLAAPGIAKVSTGLIAGTNDLRADLGIAIDGDRSAVAMALQWIVLAARAAEIPAFDGVFNGLEDEAGCGAEARQGRSLGFTGKSLIHPRQVAPAHAAFAPSTAEIERAKRLIAAYDGGAARFEDQMIERMHIAAAKRLLERSQG
ncbi:MAG: CoA ester lyase [Sphingomicrobium sp.]